MYTNKRYGYSGRRLLGFTWTVNKALLSTNNCAGAFRVGCDIHSWRRSKGSALQTAKRSSSRCTGIVRASLDDIGTERSENKPSSASDIESAQNTKRRISEDDKSLSSPSALTSGSSGESETDPNSDSDLGESSQPQEGPLYNSTLLTAMRDYFGDDGREVQDYMKRPRNSADQEMLRVVIAGNSSDDEKLARKLYESDLMRGLYYCGDGMKEERIIVAEDDEEDIHEEAVRRSQIKGMQRYADLANEGEEFSVEGVVKFATWCVADAVFIGSSCNEEFGRKVEADLAEAGITVFAHDVGRAIANEELSVVDCLSTLMQEDSVEEALLE